MNFAAVILCAGKGTRMNDDSTNKVCFEAAGVPVIKRIITEMKKGGVNTFAIVVGHHAEKVMECLDGIDGIVYAYQKEQKGTGHAALCGLNALRTVGYTGPVIVSMGDKIVASDIISNLLNKAKKSRSVFGVMPVSANKSGGRIVMAEGKPYGIVEFADACLMSLSELPENEWEKKLRFLGLSEKKIPKVMATAKTEKPNSRIILAGKSFTADEIFSTPYANSGLYCFDIESVVEQLRSVNSKNAQGELYLTDVLEKFASTNDAVIEIIDDPQKLLTYSTKPELSKLSRHFMKNASEMIDFILSGESDEYFTDYYPDDVESEKKRYISILEKFILKFGDKKVIISRSPGRVNLMGRHIDHRGGKINVMATNCDTVMVVSPRDDDTVNVSNLEDKYPDGSFVISQLSDSSFATWLDFIESKKTVDHVESTKGSWINYIKSAVLRFSYEYNSAICGMDMVATSNIPAASGLSSSSSIVVATTMAINSINSLNVDRGKLVNMCGEGEWFVGSRGGAGDHAAMICGEKGKIIQLGFKPFEIGKSAKFSDEYAIIVANSMIKAKKSEGSRDKFNEKVASYEIAFMMLKKKYPFKNLTVFRDLIKTDPQIEIYEMLKSIPEKATRKEIFEYLPEEKKELERIFSTHTEPVSYFLRAVALYGISECARAEECMKVLDGSDYGTLGNMMKISHDGDRIKSCSFDDGYFDKLISENVDISKVSGDYNCSVELIDSLCDMLNSTDGVIGSELVGAGLGGCIIALVEKKKSKIIIDKINKEYYDKNCFEHGADIYTPCCGASLLY